MADARDDRALRGDSQPEIAGGAGGVPAGPLHAVGAGGDGAPLGGRAAGRPGAAVPGDRRTNGGLDGDRDAGGALAAPRRGRLSARARQGETDSDRLTIAVPVKGRLREPSVRLLVDAGLEPEQPGERALAFPCRNAPVDVLLVRAADIPEYVQDGGVDCGITGQYLVREPGARADELLPLRFGACRPEAAVLIGGPGARAGQLVSMMRAVVEARAHRYLMLDAPEARLDEICAVIGSRSPSVLQLAEPGMVAVHALVPAKDVWQLLPKLEAVGAFSILVVPVERMLR